MTGMGTATVEDQKRAIEQWATAWSDHDLERLLPLFTENVVYEDVTMGVVNRGAAELRTFGEGFLSGFPDVTFELRSTFQTVPAVGPSGSCAALTRAICPACPLPGGA
jgi:hypothetical protein